MAKNLYRAAYGRSLLFVECSHVLSSDMYRSLERMGAMIVGPVCTVDEARNILECMDIDGAVLDKDLAGLTNLRKLLNDRDVPFIYSCNLPECKSGEHDCYRLYDRAEDPAVLMGALFGKSTTAQARSSALLRGEGTPGRAC